MSKPKVPQVRLLSPLFYELNLLYRSGQIFSIRMLINFKENHRKDGPQDLTLAKALSYSMKMKSACLHTLILKNTLN